MGIVDEENIDPIQATIRLVNNYLPLALWNFQKSFRSDKPGKLIYDSEWCRVSFVWGGWDYRGGNTISIYYGRLHASNSEAVIFSNDEECHCWHRVEYGLHFLDRRAPVDVAKLKFSHPITNAFYEENSRQKFYRRQPEWLVQMHATIWQHYGKHLFELFDLRRPDLWEQYQHFLKEVYDIAGRSPAIRPPLDKVC